MRFKGKKWVSPFFIISLAVAGLFGASAVVINKQSEEAPVNKQAEAATYQFWASFGDGSTWQNYDLSDNGNNEYKLLAQWVESGSKFVLHSGNTYFKGTYVEGGGAHDLFDTTDSDGNVIYEGTGGFYDFYAKNPHDNWWVNYYIAASSGITITRKYSLDGVDQGYDTIAHALYTSGATIPNPEARSGYGFKGWYTAASGGTKVTTATVSRTLYAQYVSDPTVTKYAVVDGVKQASSIGSDTVAYNTTYAVPNKIYRENCTFVGWYTNEACTIAYTARTLTSNLDIYAKYTTNGPWTGTIYVDLGGSGWGDATANYAIYFMDKTTYPSEIGGWSSYLSYAKDVSSLSFSYSLPFEPLQLTLVRYNPSYSEASWNTNKWPGGDYAWGQTPDISVVSFFRVTASVSEGKNQTATSNPTIGRWGPDESDIELSNRKVNGLNHYEYYSTSVVLSTNQQFGVKIDSEAIKNSFTVHKSLEGKFETFYSNIKALEGGTYAMYYDSFAKSVYITTVALAEADEWAQFFLDNVHCDATGRTEPTGWSTCATEYGKLSGDAKDIIYKASPDPEGGYVEKAVARYDAAIRSHPSLNHFIVDSKSVVRAASSISPYSPFNLINKDEDNLSTVIIIVSSSVALLSITTLSVLMVRKRKRNEQ